MAEIMKVMDAARKIMRQSGMQHIIERHGFTYCGIIYLASGDERLAYQRVVENEQ